MKYLTLIVLLILVSCGNKEDILLPKSNTTVVKNVEDHSPIYIFFRTKEKDTLAEVNRKNEIISTNWIFNIDKRLPLRLVIPEVVKLQNKKREEKAHKNEKAQNYYSYADTIGKNLAFIPFTKVFYKLEKPVSLYSFLYFKKNGMIQFYETNEYNFPKEKLEEFLNNLFIEHKSEIIFSYDKNMSYEEYIQNKILVRNLVIKRKGIWINYNQEFIY
jgi:biopolymer transport protein ExbD